MNERDLKNKLYKYWDVSPEYYEIAENVQADVEVKRKEVFTTIKEDKRVLDVACGSGRNRRDLPEKTFYCGIDISFVGLSVAKGLHANAAFLKADAVNLPMADSSFDYVISTNAVEHFIEPKLAFDEMWRVCKKGGYIVLTFPNYGDYIFKYSPSVSYMMNRPGYRIKYIMKQFYRQTARIFNKRNFYFAKIDVPPDVFINPYSPDTDVVYLASGREIKNYFEGLGAAEVNVESKERFSFASPFLRNIPRNIFRVYKAVNPYYSWHGDTVLLIKK